MISKSKIKALIFDLGNVIIDISPKSCCDYWAEIAETKPEELYSTFPFDETYAQFERGEIPPENFRSYVNDCLHISLSDEQFDEGWSKILIKIRNNVPQLLEKLHKKYRLVALSNTNAIHVPIWKELCAGILPYFEHLFSSNEIGSRKPESNAFNLVLEYLDLSPHEVFFLDDNIENIFAARNHGIRSLHVKSYDQMKRELQKCGVI